MKVVIAGSGAMGATYGSMLKKSGNDVVLLDGWQENIDKINKDGVKFINIGKEETLDIKAYQPNEYKEVPELLIVFTKSMQLRNMLNDIKHLIGDNTKVLCLLNGLGHIETLKEFVPEKNILMGVTVLTAGMQGPGVFEVSNYGKTEIQNIDENGTEGAMKVVEVFNKAGLPTEYSKDVHYSIWRKACINGTMNACCALLQCNMLELGSIDNIKELLREIISEFSMVAKHQNVDINVDEITDFVHWFTTPEFKGVKHHPSMYQDLIKNNRYTEIDYLNGYVAKKAKEYGERAKYCELITTFIHGKEKILNVK